MTPVTECTGCGGSAYLGAGRLAGGAQTSLCVACYQQRMRELRETLAELREGGD
jgi:hypothetical protein